MSEQQPAGSDDLLARVATLEARDQAWRQLALRADSMLSLIHHRGGVQWGHTGMVQPYESSAVIGALRSAYEQDDPVAALGRLEREQP